MEAESDFTREAIEERQVLEKWLIETLRELDDDLAEYVFLLVGELTKQRPPRIFVTKH